MRPDRRISRAALLGALTLTLSLAPAAFAANEPYKVGAVFSVTGGASFLGEPEKRTVEMLQEEINKAGGINGHPLEVIVLDTESDPSKANLAVKRLVKKDGVPVIIGPTTSGESLAVVPVAEEAQVPLISCAASYKIVTPVDKRHWIFKTPHSDSMVVERLYAHLKKKGLVKIAIMSDSTAYGGSGREELLRLAADNGIQVVADERFGPKDTDLTPQLAKIREAAPQAIVNWSIGPTQILAVKNWKSLSMTSIPLYQSHGFGNKKNVELAGPDAEGVMLIQSRVIVGSLLPDGHPQKAPVLAYAKAYEARYNEPVSAFGGYARDSLLLAVGALKAVGPDPAKIRDWLEDLKGWPGVHGIFNFSATDHNGLSKDDLEVITVTKGEWALAK